MRKVHIPWFLLTLSMLAVACRPKYSPSPIYTTFNDFENVTGWINNPTNNSQTIVSGDAYSGKYACVVDNALSSYTYKNKLKEISTRKISWVKISGYCKAKSDRLSKSAIVCNVQDDKKISQSWNVCFLQYFTQGKKDKWVYFEKAIDIHAANKPDYYLEAYVWSTDPADKVLVDDLKIEFFD